ncbi:MAG: hypothetical protein R3C45_19595 [Phycisphaerales bacterium]
MFADKPDMIARLEHTGRERALVYKTLLLTSLRKGELASLTAAQLQLETGTSLVAYAKLKAADEKAGRGADVPLRADLAEDLRLWLADKLDALQREASASGGPLPARLPPHTPLFTYRPG